MKFVADRTGSHKLCLILLITIDTFDRSRSLTYSSGTPEVDKCEIKISGEVLDEIDNPLDFIISKLKEVCGISAQFQRDDSGIRFVSMQITDQFLYDNSVGKDKDLKEAEEADAYEAERTEKAEEIPTTHIKAQGMKLHHA